MWGHNLEWWGAIAGILGFFIAIGGLVLTIVWPFWAPRLQNWWAERSIASTLNRIETLTGKLTECESYEAITIGEEMILKVAFLFLGIAPPLVLEVGIIITLFRWNLKNVILAFPALGNKILMDFQHRQRIEAIFIGWSSYVMALAILFMTFRVMRFLNLHGPSYREELRRLRARLMTKLPPESTKQPTPSGLEE